ncbi:MAG: NAD(P)/FAD-dependent oxidoreductase [Candidatus Paceibacterota bacterium]
MSEKVKILIVGNGFGGVYTLKNLHKSFCGKKNIELAMVGDKNYFLFTPLLHEVATGSLNPSNIIEPIREVLGCCIDKFYLGNVQSVNLNTHTVKLQKEDIAYDYLVLAPGAQTNFFNTPGSEENSFTLKNIEDAIKIKNHCIAQMERASHTEDEVEKRKMLKFVVVGGGPTGVELAAELAELIQESFYRYYKCDTLKYVSMVLIQKGPELVPQFHTKTRKKSLETLLKKGIEIKLSSTVKEVNSKFILVNDNEKIFSETVIWVGGIKPVSVSFDQEVDRTPDGRILVNEFLQLPKYKNVYAVGDVSAFKDKKTSTYLPALAQVAEKEAKTVAKNIQLTICGKTPQEFKYKSLGYLLSLGQWMAVGEIFHITFSGRFTWWLWRTVYLVKFLSLRKKIRVAIDWTMNIFSTRDISQL